MATPTPCPGRVDRSRYALVLVYLATLFQLALLFRMCKKTSKCLFWAGCGVSFHAFYSNTNFANITVLNNRGKGSPLAEIAHTQPEESPPFTAKNVFLDNTTGIYYVYSAEQRQWLEEGDVGIHFQKNLTATTARPIQPANCFVVNYNYLTNGKTEKPTDSCFT